MRNHGNIFVRINNGLIRQDPYLLLSTSFIIQYHPSLYHNIFNCFLSIKGVEYFV